MLMLFIKMTDKKTVLINGKEFRSNNHTHQIKIMLKIRFLLFSKIRLCLPVIGKWGIGRQLWQQAGYLL